MTQNTYLVKIAAPNNFDIVALSSVQERDLFIAFIRINWGWEVEAVTRSQLRKLNIPALTPSCPTKYGFAF